MVSRQSPGAGKRAIGERRPRMAPEDRERQILAAATEYFSEVGIDGQTRELAARLGVSQSLIFKYFSSKEVLLEKIYEDLYLTRWNPSWEETVVDRTRSIEDRMICFYRDYANMILRKEWIRIFLFSGLRDSNIHSRFLQLLQKRIFVPLAEELRHAFEHDGVDKKPLTELEIQMVWSSHSKIFYYGLRKWVYKTETSVGIDEFIECEVQSFLAGYPYFLKKNV